MMLIGIGIKNTNSTLKFKNTTFIAASEISPALNYLCDGAISLRFDHNSESSFLREMTTVAQTNETYVTIFIGRENHSVTIGDLSVKYAVQGISSVSWVTVKEDGLYGKLLHCSKIQFT
jgi:transcriptional regulator of heat shock response